MAWDSKQEICKPGHFKVKKRLTRVLLFVVSLGATAELIGYFLVPYFGNTVVSLEKKKSSSCQSDYIE